MLGTRLLRSAPGPVRATAGAAMVTFSLMACGGGGGAGGDPGAGEGATVYPDAVPLVDGRVGDSPFYDDGGAGGLADGRVFQRSDGAPVVITWSPATHQLDRTPELQLAGYRVYYGHQPGNYDFVVEIGDPSAQGYRLAGLAPGTYYFAVSAVDGDNREGPLSSVASFTVSR